MAPTTSTSSSLSGLWGRMACCAPPPATVTEFIEIEDYNDSTITTSSVPPVAKVVTPTKVRPPQQQGLRTGRHFSTTSSSIMKDLPSPTLTPARRNLDRLELPPSTRPYYYYTGEQNSVHSTAAYYNKNETVSEGSNATVSTILTSTSEDDFDTTDADEVKSNAITEIVSNRHSTTVNPLKQDLMLKTLSAVADKEFQLKQRSIRRTRMTQEEG